MTTANVGTDKCQYCQIWGQKRKIGELTWVKTIANETQ